MNDFESIESMQLHHAKMKRAFNLNPMPTHTARVEKLKSLRQALIEFSERICVAMSADYGNRSFRDTKIADVLPCIANIDYSIEHVEGWMAPSVRHSGALLSVSEVEVVYQPKGVVGIVTPWNFPVMLSIGPLISAITAGNRAMIKMSEFTPKTNQIVSEMLASVFSSEEVAVVEGEVEISSAFTALPFDHLLFTGSTAVGRLVMESAAKNLTPVTLELGGKSPVIVADDVSVELAVERVIFGKSLNNGQVCVAPDYVLVPESKKNDFIEEYKNQYQNIFKNGVDSKNLTSIVNERQFSRIFGLLNAELEAGTRVESCHVNSINEAERRLVTHLVVDPSPTSTIMEEEIFGPLLPVIGYDDIEKAIEFIANRPSPLALYLMSFNEELQSRIKNTILSGGMCIMDCVFHLAADDAPFGGVGDSGMGNYHGQEGFITFSHAKTVLKSGHEHQMKYLFSDEENEFKSAVFAMLEK